MTMQMAPIDKSTTSLCLFCFQALLLRAWFGLFLWQHEGWDTGHFTRLLPGKTVSYKRGRPRSAGVVRIMTPFQFLQQELWGLLQRVRAAAAPGVGKEHSSVVLRFLHAGRTGWCRQTREDQFWTGTGNREATSLFYLIIIYLI